MARTGNHCVTASWGICGIQKTNVCQLLPCNTNVVSPLFQQLNNATRSYLCLDLAKRWLEHLMVCIYGRWHTTSSSKTVISHYTVSFSWKQFQSNNVIKYFIIQKSLANNKSKGLENKYSNKDQSGSFSNRESNQSSNSNQDYWSCPNILYQIKSLLTN